MCTPPAAPHHLRAPPGGRKYDTQVDLDETMKSCFALAACLIFAATAGAEPRFPILRQLTHITTGDIEWPRARMQDGDAVSFVATGDVLGPGSETGGREVYLWRAGSTLLVKITDSGPYESHSAARPTDNVNAGGRPDVVVFVSTADLDENRDNADANPEIFLWELENDVFHQLTDTVAPVVNSDPFASDNGRCIVFASSGDLADNPGTSEHPNNGFRNPDGSDEVFMYSKLDGGGDYPFTGVFAQMSSGPAGTRSSRPVVGGYWWTRQCQTAAFQSDHDQVPDDGIDLEGTHIYIYRRPRAQIELMASPREIPNGLPAGNYLNPHISNASPFARGPFVVFETDTDLWNNGATGTNLFRYRIFHPRMTQYTDTRMNGGEVRRPVVSDGGGIVAFDSTGEHVFRARRGTPGNADGNAEIFRLKGRRKVWQVTKTEGCENTQASIKDDGRAIVFRSTCDLIPGRNPGARPQVFLWRLLRRDDPAYAACMADEDCCSEQDGCYRQVLGRQRRPPRANCLERQSSCN